MGRLDGAHALKAVGTELAYWTRSGRPQVLGGRILLYCMPLVSRNKVAFRHLWFLDPTEFLDIACFPHTSDIQKILVSTYFIIFLIFTLRGPS